MAGYSGPDGGDCTICDAGTYKMGDGSGICEPCPDGTSSAAGSTNDAACISCAPGYTKAGSAKCYKCPKGTFKTAPGTNACGACPRNTDSDEGSTQKEDCTCVPGHAAGENGKSNKQTDCKCVAGYTAVSDGMDCTACAEGTFKDWPGAGICSGCPDGTGSDEGSGKLTDCKCLVGYSGDADGVELVDGSCMTCNAGTYNDVSGGSECQACPAGSGSTARSSECHMCDIGMYNPTKGGVCTGCPPGTTTAKKGSTEKTQCKCKAGHFGGLDGKPCQKCAVGTVKSWEGNGMCTDCQEGTFNDARGAVECTPC
ncbi:hypothetical protein T484DRAFT_1645172, partial [Baffinella frigidus]